MRRFAFVVMLLLAASGMMLEAGSVPHLHAAHDAGVYNEEHDLTLLASLAGHVVLADAPVVPSADGVPASAPALAPQHAPRPLADSGESRAPPAL